MRGIRATTDMKTAVSGATERTRPTLPDQLFRFVFVKMCSLLNARQKLLELIKQPDVDHRKKKTLVPLI